MFEPKDIIYFWFYAPFDDGASIADKRKLWFSINRNFDRQIRRQLISYTTLASEGGTEHWLNSATGYLATILLLDRATRSCYRRSSMAYSNDTLARKLTKRGIELALDYQLLPEQRLFFLFPLIASEKIDDQLLAKARLEGSLHSLKGEILNLMQDCVLLIDRNILLLREFSCFPHRSRTLGRGITSNQAAFLESYSWQEWL